MEHFYHTLGEHWFSYPTLYSEVVKLAPDNSHFVEVGVWKGMSAAFMAVEIFNSGKNIRFDCIDTWGNIEFQQDIPSGMYKDLYKTFLNNIQPVRPLIFPIRELSWKAAELYEDNSLDFVFIDAGHDYESIKKDIEAYYPKVKSGGILAGHDYTNQYTGVPKAVNEFFAGKTVGEIEECWVYNKE